MERILTCPVCAAPLTEEPSRFVCPSGHAFDRAREGYVNLLTGSRPGDAIGDNRDMARARHAFLDSGAFSCLRDELHKTLARLMPQGGVLCDAACGDGYYTEGLPENIKVYGFDISKYMLKYAGKRNEKATYFAAGVTRIPARDAAFDGILHVVAPYCDREFARVLAQDGFVLSVGAGARHLWELKEVLYDEPYENDEAPLPATLLEEVSCVSLRDRVKLTGRSEIDALFAMTPYRYRTPPAGQARLQALDELEVELDFLLRVLRKK